MDKTKTYEGMFLVDSSADFEAASEPIRKILARSEAEILACKPWDDRKLAYEIEGRKRGLYALTYFKADPLRIAEIEHDCRLDERVLRVLILRRDVLTEDEIKAETPATGGARRAAERRAREGEEGAEGVEGGEGRERDEEGGYEDRPRRDRDSDDGDRGRDRY